MAAYSGIFNGVKYKFYGMVDSKTQAQGLAKILRKDGRLARVKHIAGGYHIWYK